MHLANLLIIPVILTGLFWPIRVSYIISLLASLALVIVAYGQQAMANLLFSILLFNLTPLFCRQLSAIVGGQRAALKTQKQTARHYCVQMQKENSLIRQSNFHLNEEAFLISELYKITRDLSAVLSVEEGFDLFGKKLMEHFRFTSCRLVLTDQESEVLNIKKVLQLQFNQAQPQQVDIQIDDMQFLQQSLRKQKIHYLEKKSAVLVPLSGEHRFVGNLIVQGLAFDKLEPFSTLANQFCLIMKKIELYTQIQKMAINDGLTGLFVRRHFLERLQEEMQRNTRYHMQMSFLMVDIDHFKHCNDRFGHLAGDIVLTEVAGILKGSVREIDLVARLGGEEFAVLLPDTGREGAKNVAERIRATVDRHEFSAYGQQIKVEVSIGVGVFPEDATSLQVLIDRADQALYRAKQEGRNRISLWG